MRFACLASLCLAMLGAHVHAQTEADAQAAPSNPPSVMKEDQVSENALIDALTPEEPIRTRSIRAVREAPATVPKANLLVTFDTNSARLTPGARKALDVVAHALESDQLAARSFVIEGHADPRGSEDANMKLSRERAESVRQYLSSKGVDMSRLQPIGKGAKDLLKPTDPTAPENRRVTFVTVMQ